MKKHNFLKIFFITFLCFANNSHFCRGVSNKPLVSFDLFDVTTFVKGNLPTSLNSFTKESYFKNLYKYSPKNSVGSCGFVSLIQNLSYLDTFVNDDIIPEKYEKTEFDNSNITEAIFTSPGVLRQDYPLDSKENRIGFYNFVQNNFNLDYQMNLIKDYNQIQGNNSDNYEYSINMREYNKILEDIEYEYYEENDINLFDYSIKELNKGNPVILHIRKKSDLSWYHSIVAYAYDSEGIHVNFGWDDRSTTDMLLTRECKYKITEAGILKTNTLNHKCSNNYFIDGLSYCGCGNHTHIFNNFEQKDEKRHKTKCNCGIYSFEQAHVISINDTGKRFVNCIGCGYLLDLNKDLGFVVSNKISNKNNGESYKLNENIYVLNEEDERMYLRWGIL